jgi:hypothetical protein
MKWSTMSLWLVQNTSRAYHLLTGWAKDDRDRFDVVADFIFQVRASFFGNSWCKFTRFNRDPTRIPCYYITMTFKTFSKYYSLCIRSDPLFTLVQGDEKKLTRLLAKSGVAERIEVDENGGRPLSCIANSQVLTFSSWTTSQRQRSSLSRFGTFLTAFTPHASLTAISSSDHGGRVPTT